MKNILLFWILLILIISGNGWSNSHVECINKMDELIYEVKLLRGKK